MAFHKTVKKTLQRFADRQWLDSSAFTSVAAHLLAVHLAISTWEVESLQRRMVRSVAVVLLVWW